MFCYRAFDSYPAPFASSFLVPCATARATARRAILTVRLSYPKLPASLPRYVTASSFRRTSLHAGNVWRQFRFLYYIISVYANPFKDRSSALPLLLVAKRVQRYADFLFLQAFPQLFFHGMRKSGREGEMRPICKDRCKAIMDTSSLQQ